MGRPNQGTPQTKSTRPATRSNGLFQKFFTSFFWSNDPSLLSIVLLWSNVLHFFTTLPTRIPTVATILGKLSFQKWFTSLCWSNAPSFLSKVLLLELCFLFFHNTPIWNPYFCNNFRQAFLPEMVYKPVLQQQHPPLASSELREASRGVAGSHIL